MAVKLERQSEALEGSRTGSSSRIHFLSGLLTLASPGGGGALLVKVGGLEEERGVGGNWLATTEEPQSPRSIAE